MRQDCGTLVQMIFSDYCVVTEDTLSQTAMVLTLGSMFSLNKANEAMTK